MPGRCSRRVHGRRGHERCVHDMNYLELGRELARGLSRVFRLVRESTNVDKIPATVVSVGVVVGNASCRKEAFCIITRSEGYGYGEALRY